MKSSQNIHIDQSRLQHLRDLDPWSNSKLAAVSGVEHFPKLLADLSQEFIHVEEELKKYIKR